MKIDFMDEKGEIFATSAGVTMRNGKLVPDSRGLPVLLYPCGMKDRCLFCHACPRDEECRDRDY